MKAGTIYNEKVAVIILNYNSWEDTLKEIECCNELLHIDYRDIIVVDNASTNDSLENLKIASKSNKFILISSGQNLGYAYGNNIGMRYALTEGYKYGWILNNDIIIDDPELLNKMIRVLRDDKSVAVVNPDIYATDGHMFNRDSIRPSFADMTIGMLGYRKKGRILKDMGGYGYIYRPQGCCMLVDLEKMNEVDYMDEKTFLYCEEPILAERLLEKQYQCACCCSTKVIHNHSTTVKSVFNKRKITKMNNVSLEYYLKEYRGFNNLQIKICLLFNTIKIQVLS